MTRALRRLWVGLFGIAVVTAAAAIPSGVRLNSSVTALHLPDARWSIADLEEALADLQLEDYVLTLLPYAASVLLGFGFLAAAALIV